VPRRSGRGQFLARCLTLTLAASLLPIGVRGATDERLDGPARSRLPTALIAYATAVSHGSRATKRIALTIDDGASPKACAAMLEILRRKRVPATFFPVARYVAGAPALWRSIAAQGFPIGNHTYDHPVLTRLSYAHQVAEIVQARRTVEAVTHVRMIRVVRPPTGAYNASVLRAARAAGFGTLLTWDTTFGDTSSRPSMVHQIRNAERGRNGSVILMHCKAISVKTLEPVIDYYLARGFTFVTVPQLLGFKGPVPVFPPIPPGRAALAAWPFIWRD
jgi:peptidoglycan/xylan/chitin deacetylase (PgdA/CDA1 family)